MKLIKCPICKSKSQKTFLKTDTRTLVKCSCGLVFQNPMPSKKKLSQYYSEEYFKTESPEEQKHGYTNYEMEEPYYRNYFKKQLIRAEKYKSKKGKLLDIGCALGFAISEAEKRGWKSTGLDLTQYAVDYCKKSGLKAIQGDIDSIKLKEGEYDFIIASHVLEHVIDPEKFLIKAKKLLKPGGIIFLAMPNQTSLVAKVLGKNWFDYRRIQHIWYFNKKSIKRLLENQGFSVLNQGEDLNVFPTVYTLIKIRRYYKSRFIQTLSKIADFVTFHIGPKKLALPLGNMHLFAKKDE